MRAYPQANSLLGQIVHTIRTRKKMTQRELASTLRWLVSKVSKIENGLQALTAMELIELTVLWQVDLIWIYRQGIRRTRPPGHRRPLPKLQEIELL